MPIRLTPAQKLHALAFTFYQGAVWKPEAGDLYTTSRADLQLYEVVRIGPDGVTTRYADPAKGHALSVWPAQEFLSPETFGRARVWVPDWIFDVPETLAA